jgi:hypothetical protein
MTSLPLLHRRQITTCTRQRTESESTRSSGSIPSLGVLIGALSKSSLATVGSSSDVNYLSLIATEQHKVDSHVIHSTRFNGCCCVKAVSATPCTNSSICQTLLTTVTDCHLLRNPRYLLFLTAACLICPGCGLFTTYIPPLAADLNIDKNSAAFLVSLAGGTDIVGRILCGLLADRGWIGRHYIVAMATICLGIAINMAPLCTEFWSVALLCCCYGLLGGVYFTIYPVILIDFIGIENMASAMGMVALVHGVSASIMMVTIGKLLYIVLYIHTSA